MKKDWIRNVIALVVLSGLVLYVSSNRKKTYEANEKTEEAKKLVQIDWAPIERIEIKNLEGKVVLVKRPTDAEKKYTDQWKGLSDEFNEVSAWAMAEPASGLSDYYFVKTLIDNVKETASTKLVDEKGENVEQYSLKTPTVEVDLYEKNKTAPTFVLKIGDSNSANSGLYVQTSQSPKVHLTEMTLEYLKTRKPNEWRSKDILGFKDNKSVEKIDAEYWINGKQEQFSVVRSGEKWTLSNSLPADARTVEQFLTNVSSTKSEHIVSDQADQDATRYGFSKPYGKWVFTMAGGKEKKTLVMASNKNNETFLRRLDANQIFVISTSSKTTLTRKMSDLVDKRPFGLSDAAITQVGFTKDTQVVEIEKKNEHWNLKKPIVDSADDLAVSSLVSKLTSLMAKEYVPGLTKGTGKPLATFQIKDGSESREVSFFPSKDPKIVEGFRLEPKLGYRFEKDDLDALMAAAENLREKRLMPYDSSNLSSFVIKKDKTVASFKRDSSKGDFLLIDFQGDAGVKRKFLSKEAIDLLIQNIEGLKLNSFLEPEASRKEEMSIELHPIKGDAQVWSLAFDADHKVVAWSTTRKVLGELSGVEIESLQSIFSTEKQKHE